MAVDIVAVDDGDVIVGIREIFAGEIKAKLELGFCRVYNKKLRLSGDLSLDHWRKPIVQSNNLENFEYASIEDAVDDEWRPFMNWAKL